MTATATCGSMNDLPVGYELRTVALEQDTALKYYQRVSAITANGVPGATYTQGAVESFLAAHREIQGLIAGLGGESEKAYRVRYTAGELDYIKYVGEERGQSDESIY